MAAATTSCGIPTLSSATADRQASKLFAGLKRVSKKILPFVCDQCPEKFSKLAKLKGHLKTIHNFVGKVTAFTCKICAKKFSIRGCFIKHLNSHQQDNSDQLVHPSKSANPANTSRLDQPVEPSKLDISHLPNPDQPDSPSKAVQPSNSDYPLNLSRPDQSANSSKQDQPENHSKSEKTVKALKSDKPVKSAKRRSKPKRRTKLFCQICSERFRRFEKLKTHLRSDHSFDGKIRPFRCEVCNTKYSSKTRFLKHAERHDREGEKTSGTNNAKLFSLLLIAARITWSSLYKEESLACQITSPFNNKLLKQMQPIFLLNGEVIWQASDSSLSKELHGLGITYN